MASTDRYARGHVVMLVDNSVTGDSRVQKQARSAASAGWDVTLLGRSATGQPQTWQLGGATVRLLVVGGAPGLRGGVRRAAGLSRSLRRLRRPVEKVRTSLWLSLMGDRAWRRLEPALWDFESAFGPVIDELAPDLIHANDFRMLGVGARALIRARERGGETKLVWDAHEFLPGIKPWRDNAWWLPAHRGYEREYAPYADAVVTVSDEVAQLLRREHGLSVAPTIVLNAPDLTPDERGPSGTVEGLREACGVATDVPLLVYSGAASPPRGLSIMIDALPTLERVHVALVVNLPTGTYAAELMERACALGVAERVHLLDYVPHDRVVRFLSEADAGVIPIQHWPNHEISLITKFFEYSHARLPIVVSDVRTMAGTVRRTGQGEVFRAEDVADYVRAVRAVLGDPGRYRAAYDVPGLLAGWTWNAQAEVLDSVYSGLVPDGRSLVHRADRSSVDS
jgi:glycosyltransferase involved in cell wall biosynthesis